MPIALCYAWCTTQTDKENRQMAKIEIFHNEHRDGYT